MSLALQWIKNCDEHHIFARAPPVENSPNWRPTRRIYVGVDDMQLRLVHGRTLPDDIAYATLSHCWGTLESRLVLTKANIDHWIERLPLLAE
jgi:hypothetical protein